MSSARILVLTSLAMTAFAGNSLFCRLALKQTGIDAASFTSVRLVSAALTLWLILRAGRKADGIAGNWPSAAALFIYAACFSFAYVSLPAATGALLLFGAVQTSMIGFGIWKGERLHGMQLAGFALALGGLAGLMLPGLSAPPLYGAILMLSAGIAWGIYSLRGRGAGDPLMVTAGNFLRTVPLTLGLSFLLLGRQSFDMRGFIYAILSGALASGVGYTSWYHALPHLKATKAAAVQLSVPVLAALGGVVFLNEPISLRIILASIAILAGIALVVLERKPD